MNKLLFIFVLIVFTSCDLLLPVTSTSKDSDELTSAPEIITIDDREYFLETFMWRDFQPVSPPDGKPLIALIWVTATDSLAIPPEIDATRIWVVKGEEVWESKFSDEKRPDPIHKFKLEKIARNGPKWGPNVAVDVVVRVINKKNGEEFLLRAADQYIGMTM